MKQIKSGVTIEDYAQKLLDLGMTKEMIKKATPANILQAQKVLLEKEKLKVERDTLKIAMLKFMSGFARKEDEDVVKNKVIDAEPVEEVPDEVKEIKHFPEPQILKELT